METKTLQILQTNLTQKFGSDRDTKLNFLSDVFEREITSSKELEEWEAQDLLLYFRNGTMPSNRSYALFDKNNRQHSTIRSRCHVLGWKDKELPQYVDLERLGTFIKSKFHKPLLQMNSTELNKVINALNSITTKEFTK